MQLAKSEIENELIVGSFSPEIASPIIDVDKIPSLVLQRLIEEVRYERENNILAYNRTHNRHNRGR
jgi:hypothetical protein